MRMAKKNYQIAIFWIAFFFVSCFCYGENYFLISKADLEKYDVDIKKLNPVNLAPDGSYFVAGEGVQDLEKRAQGFTRMLRVLRFSQKKLSKVDTILLPITQWVNAVVNDTKNEVLILGNQGTKILRVNLDTMQLETLWEHKKGKAGFKIGPSLLCDKGTYYATGWFYDEQQFWQGDFLVQLGIKEEKKGQFEVRFLKRVKLDDVFINKEEEFNKAHYYISGTELLYNIVKIKERKTHLMHYKNKQIHALDKGFLLDVFIGNAYKIFYSVVYDEKPEVLQHFVMDLKTKKKWKIGADNEYYTYPFLSPKGDKLLVCVLNERYKVLTVYIAKEKDNYHLDKLLHNVPIGPMHISADGNVYSLMTPQWLRIGNF